MERSFKQEVELLKLGEGETFHGEGILAVTKALLQSGVAYVGGYQGAPVSHMMDVLNDARDIMAELGVHIETNASEAGAAAMLGASINYPLRGAVTFKSTVGTNVASDALSNLASAGVKGGALIVLGEDYGEGSSIIQERSQAFAMKSQMWLLDPRPNLPTIVEMVEKAFELSEASNTPVLLELRIRACHVHGSFVTKKNLSSKNSKNNPIAAPDFDFGRISLPPATYAQEKHKIEVRWPAAVAFIRENRLNEVFAGDLSRHRHHLPGRHVQRHAARAAAARARRPVRRLESAHLLHERRPTRRSRKRSWISARAGSPCSSSRKASPPTSRTRCAPRCTAMPSKGSRFRARDFFPLAGEYTGEVVLNGIAAFLGRLEAVENVKKLKQKALDLLGAVPARPPGFCVGCPERPVFAAMKVAEKETGAFHVSADIGCHTFATLPPFHIGHTVLGYGLGLASNSAIHSMFGRRTVTIMGDGGFWHNGLTSGIANAVFNKDDGILVIMKNGYSSATGTQELPSSPQHSEFKSGDMAIERALEGVGVGWVKTVDNYRVGDVAKVLKEAMSTDYKELKVIIAEGECQLERQRKLRPLVAKNLSEGKRTVRVKYGVDEDTCTGDHSCIRLSGCPTLTVKDNPDPLRRDPVATVIDGCVGCGLCGENAHAAVLCPSFYRAEVIQNPTLLIACRI